MCYHLAKTHRFEDPDGWGGFYLMLRGVCFAPVIQAHRLSFPSMLNNFSFSLRGRDPLLVGTKEGTKHNKSLFLSIAHACAELFSW